jgi:nitroreductase
MDFEELVHSRRSVRGFKAVPVPRSVIEEIIEIAKRAPSSMNTQPWHVHVLTGEPLERVRQRNMAEMVAGAKPKRDIVSHSEYQGIHRGRQVDIAKKLFGAMGIARDDKPMRQDWVLRGFRQFDAPVSLVLTYDRVLDPGAGLPLRSRRAVLRHCPRGVGPGAWQCHQRAGYRPFGYRPRGGRHPRG